ncbi:MAG TPA: pyridoxamine 5'-phosphate oxidase family protein [Bacteroidia bacterium]|nr:pyridoxamine 5'-phosphate oxidase family protein [Bacteroidia bacterium]
MTKDFLFRFLREHKLAVISSLSSKGKPESALVGIAVTENLELIFDTVMSSRKYSNIIAHPGISAVIGWENETTVQYEGVASVVKSDEEIFREIYFDAFPDGRERFKTWPGLVHFVVRPKWIRYSSFHDPQQVEEMSW